MVALTYRTNDVAKWGTGKGSNLTPSEVDDNFYSIEVAIADLISDRPEPNNIVSISRTGTQLIVHLQDGTAVGPVPLPILTFRWLGDWTPSTAFVQLDAFRVVGVGLYFVLLDHTSDLTFDENATDGLGNPLYYKLFEAQAAGLAGLSDVQLTGLADGQYIKWDATASKWINVTLPGVHYDSGCSVPGLMTASQILLRLPITCSVTMAANFGTLLGRTSQAEAEVAAAADTVIDVYQRTAGVDTHIGAITFLTGSSVGTFTTDGGAVVNFVAGDVLKVVGPATPDTALSDFSANFVGQQI